MYCRYRKGSLTLEVLIAFAVLTLSITSVVVVAFGNQSNSIDTELSSIALYKAKALLESARALSRQNFNNVKPVASTTDGVFEQSLYVNDLDDSTKAISSNVSWTSSASSLSLSLDTVVTGPPSSNTCSSKLRGDWQGVRHFDFASPNLMPTYNGSGIGISDLRAYHHKLYVVAKTNANSNDTFYIFDLPNDPSVAPVYLGSLDNSATVSAGLNALTVFGNYAYVANAYTGSASTCNEGANCAQLQVINISNPSFPYVARNLKISAIASGNKLAAGSSIFYSKGYIYIGLSKVSGGGSEFNVVDVGGGGSGASPTNPIWKGGYAGGSGINSIYVKGSYAYTATPNSENITVLDISDPAHPTRVGGYTPISSPESNGVGSNHGESLFVYGSDLLLGRTYGTNEFYVLNMSDPAHVSTLGNIDIGSGNTTSIKSVILREHLAFTLSGSKFQILDVSNPSNISVAVNIPLSDFTNGAGTGTGIAMNCSGDILYSALTSPSGSNKDIISVITSN